MPVVHELFLPNRNNTKCYKRYAVCRNDDMESHLAYIDVCTDLTTGEGCVEIYAYDREAKTTQIQLAPKDISEFNTANHFSLEKVNSDDESLDSYCIAYNLHSACLVEINVQLKDDNPVALMVKNHQDLNDNVCRLSLY